MASSIGTIYNATIGSSELEPDNEHTLFTTNSSTTQIIKNIDITPGAGLKLTGTYLEVNGHNAADLSNGSVSGELIIPPNSTVKIKDYSYPVTFYKEYEQFIDGSGNYGWVNVHVRDEDNGNIVHTFTQNKSATALQSPTNIVEILDGLHDHDANGTTSNERNANKYMSYIYHDNNSVQQAYNNYSYLHTFGNTPSTSNYLYVNYRPLMLDRDPRRGQQYACPIGGTCWYVNNMYDVSSGYVYAYGSLNTAQTSQTQYTRWNGQNGTPVSPATNQGSFSPGNTSSYPRGHCIGDWIFYVPSSGYTDRVYGIYLNTGQLFHFQCSPNATVGGNYDFTVSINQATDKLVIWRSDGANARLIRNVPEKTITELATLTPGGNQQINCDSTYVTTPDNHARHSFASCQLSDQMDGGVGFIGHNTNKFHSIDFDGVEKYSHTQFSGASNTTVNYAQNYLWKRTMMPLSSAELTAAGITQPTMGVKIIGYTST